MEVREDNEDSTEEPITEVPNESTENAASLPPMFLI
ncbi:hypothetical protein L917_12797 [Phytophthora nicotianae]|uniref:Uncharacterized protein n=1 Tax=Phytophthora nicotianae TaxID=4792 RepID=W2GGU6_PHYNI|nr:hypothetical protein L915_13063 [Phytophthora nicotianae]ETL88106.1 hypothetical protein L917_12797 [Phytophthora nicotianae]